MYISCYALEVMTKTKLAELRADAARYRALASLRTPRPGAWALSRGQVLHSRIAGPNSAPAQQRLPGPDVGFQDLTPLTSVIRR
jgi:hypothetical protein